MTINHKIQIDHAYFSALIGLDWSFETNLCIGLPLRSDYTRYDRT